MSRLTDDIYKEVANIKKEMVDYKSNQPVSNKDIVFYRYTGTFSHTGSSPMYMVFTLDNSHSPVIIQMAYEAPSVMNYLFLEYDHPVGVYYADISQVPASSAKYYIITTAKGSTNITAIKPT